VSANSKDPFAADIGDILIRSDEIRRTVSEMGSDISRDYSGKTPILVGVLKGVLYFMADLVRAMTIPVQLDFIAISRYSPLADGKGMVRFIKDLDMPINGRHVLFVEDVVDTGLTLSYILRNLKLRDPSSLQVCVLFNKPKHRLVDIPIRYKGFDLPDRIVVGYGLDYREKYRNLSYVGLLRPQVFQGRPTG
jgi:hypoxanthine phosphoribosyltransferase